MFVCGDGAVTRESTWLLGLGSWDEMSPCAAAVLIDDTGPNIQTLNPQPCAVLELIDDTDPNDVARVVK